MNSLAFNRMEFRESMADRWILFLYAMLRCKPSHGGRLTALLIGITLSMQAMPCFSQVVNTATMDTLETTTLGHIAVGGYVDTYWAYNLTNTKSKALPYAVSSARNNELSINLAYVDVRYRSNRIRARLVPGFGSYMDANYAHESGTIKNLVEANAGVMLSAKRKIWLDVGILGSPYTNESAISKDHLMYTRSLAPENVPYYLTGVKLNLPVSERVNAFLYVLNGWQIIDDTNEGKSVGTQLEYRPSSKMLFNWNTYWGDERSQQRPDYRKRFFTDLYWIYKPNPRFDATSCVYIGSQGRSQGTDYMWWQANVIGRVAVTPVVSVSGRLEYFSDPDQALVSSMTSVPSFSTFSSGMCLNLKVTDNALFRLEAKQYFANDRIYSSASREVQGNTLLVGSLAAWF